MSHRLIKDFGLSRNQLEAKYDDQGHHPVIKAADWRRAVRDSQTELGYWDYVYGKIVKYQEELEDDNPLNAWTRGLRTRTIDEPSMRLWGLHE